MFKFADLYMVRFFQFDHAKSPAAVWSFIEDECTGVEMTFVKKNECGHSAMIIHNNMIKHF